MVTTTRLRMCDISRQKRLEVDLSGQLTPRHTIGQAIQHYLREKRIPDEGSRWSAFSRGVRLDNKQTLEELSEQDTELTILPEVSAG